MWVCVCVCVCVYSGSKGGGGLFGDDGDVDNSALFASTTSEASTKASSKPTPSVAFGDDVEDQTALFGGASKATAAAAAAAAAPAQTGKKAGGAAGLFGGGEEEEAEVRAPATPAGGRVAGSGSKIGALGASLNFNPSAMVPGIYRALIAP